MHCKGQQRHGSQVYYKLGVQDIIRLMHGRNEENCMTYDYNEFLLKAPAAAAVMQQHSCCSSRKSSCSSIHLAYTQKQQQQQQQQKIT